jgi:hypothetical protein
MHQFSLVTECFPHYILLLYLIGYLKQLLVNPIGVYLQLTYGKWISHVWNGKGCQLSY